MRRLFWLLPLLTLAGCSLPKLDARPDLVVSVQPQEVFVPLGQPAVFEVRVLKVCSPTSPLCDTSKSVSTFSASIDYGDEQGEPVDAVALHRYEQAGAYRVSARACYDEQPLRCGSGQTQVNVVADAQPDCQTCSAENAHLVAVLSMPAHAPLGGSIAPRIYLDVKIPLDQLYVQVEADEDVLNASDYNSNLLANVPVGVRVFRPVLNVIGQGTGWVRIHLHSASRGDGLDMVLSARLETP